MEPERRDEHLSRISTLWTLLQQAHAGPVDATLAAQRILMQRYCGAAYRYLLGALRDEDAAAELFQEFALRFIRGDFQRADPGRGRFRDYLRTVLINLVNDRKAAARSHPRPLSVDIATPDETTDLDDPLDRSWREELLNQTWVALEQSNPTYHAVLLARVERPDAIAAELANLLSNSLGRPFDAGQLRVTIHRARIRFAELLLEEVKLTLEQPAEDELRDELQRLRLLPYCEAALRNRQEPAGG